MIHCRSVTIGDYAQADTWPGDLALPPLARSSPALNHRCFAGRAHRWLARVLHPRRASHVRHVAALQAASRRAPRLRQRPRAATGDLAARCARALMRDAAHGSAGRRAAWPPPLSSTKL